MIKEDAMPEKMGKGDYDYASMVWIRDKDGKEYACYLDDIKGKIKTKEELSDEEKANCLDVSQIVGTERW
jgi:hypothetical protein